jgi:NADH:ubiquinone oxidoreductase subunit 6 (subunit J)
MLYVEAIISFYLLIGAILYRFKYKKIFDELMEGAPTGTQVVTVFFAVVAWPKMVKATITDYRRMRKL